MNIGKIIMIIYYICIRRNMKMVRRDDTRKPKIDTSLLEYNIENNSELTYIQKREMKKKLIMERIKQNLKGGLDKR
jgi:hypothetical protein